MALWLLCSAWSMSVSTYVEEVRPVRLVTEDRAGRLELRVVGQADRPIALTYSLEVTGGGGNRTRQRGDARLEPGQRVDLMTLTLGNSQAGWRARLSVQPETGEAYEITRSHDAAEANGSEE